MRKFLTAIGLAAFAVSASADQTFFSELLINPDGTDNGLESIEIQGAAGTAFDGWFYIVVEGDGGNAGVVDQVVPLDGYSTGANGLLLLRDSSTVIAPGPAADTNVYVRDFNPDIENGANTHILGYGTINFSVGTDLDTNNDGVLDVSLDGFTTSDAFAYLDGDSGGIGYGAAFGGVDLGDLGTFTPDGFYRILDNARTAPDRWAGGDTNGNATDGIGWDLNETFGWGDVNPADVPMSLGVINIPEPTALALLALGGLGLIRRR